MTKLPHAVLRKPADKWTSEDSRTVSETYKLLIEMADRVSQRRQAANNFYLSVNTAIIGASAYISTVGQNSMNIFVVAIAGIGVCILWQRNIQSYKTLNEAKFHVINDIEKLLPLSPYTAEWAYLDPDGDGRRHRPFHLVEIIVPRIFMAVHTIQAVHAISWNAVWSSVSSALKL